MMELIEAYIKDHAKAWSTSTQKSEYARLICLANIIDGNPDRLWTYLEMHKYKPYSRVTIWTRVANFWSWSHKEGSNPYQKWRNKNALLFKNTYQRKTPTLSFEEARTRITKIKDAAIRHKATQLLFAGLRYNESLSLSDNTVVGKGKITRKVYGLDGSTGPDYSGSYWTFWKALQDVGLKPHDLRKIRATALVRKGMDIFSLQQAMGWKSVETANCYVAPLMDEEIKKFFK